MRTPARLALLLACLLAPSPRAQGGGSPLAGKTVHLLNPFHPVKLVIDLAGTAFPVTGEGPWLDIRLSDLALGPQMQGFYFRSADHQARFGRAGITDGTEFRVEDFAGGDELWILLDPQAPATAAPVILTAPPRKVHLFNPWPVSGPAMVIDGVARGMQVNRQRCGWYTALVLEPAAKAHFVDVADGEAWGKGGYGSAEGFDLAAAFAAHGPEVWIGRDGAVTRTFPGETGDCSYRMAALVHDMAVIHPDYGPTGGLTFGMVEPVLGPDRKPVPTAKAPANFRTWFNADSTRPMPLKGYRSCVDLEMGKADDGLWEYDSYRTPARGYYPIDDRNRLDQNTAETCVYNPLLPNLPPEKTGEAHNFGFCMESHATFIYKKGQVFEFRGDDDVWVFIDGRLALDLGGVHIALPGRIDMDSLARANGLVEGKEYKWDFFYCERKKCSSSLRIKTTIHFKQQKALDHVEERLPDGSVRWRVIKRVGGSGACGSETGTVTEVAPQALVYVLHPESGPKLRDLPQGTSLGGITIETPRITVDTARILDLPAGTYRIVYYEPADARVKNEVRFVIAARNRVELEPPYARSDSLGTWVPVVAANRLRGALAAAAAPWIPVLPPGLVAYEDAARTRRVAPGALLTTGPDGLDTLWMGGDPAATSDRTYGVAAAGSDKRVSLTFVLPPLDLPRAIRAEAFDDDADGVADRVAAAYDRDISAALPKRAALRWPAAGTERAFAPADLAGRLAGGGSLVFRGPLGESPATAGTGLYTSVYEARGRDSAQFAPVLDRIAPVLLKAEIALGAAFDTLRLAFSEPVAVAAPKAGSGDLFLYRVSQAGGDFRAEAASLSWSPAGDTAILLFPAGAPEAPRAGNLVRIQDGPGRVADALGNAPGPNSRFRAIVGARRSGIESVTYRRMDGPPGPAVAVTATLESQRATAAEVAERTGRLGHLIKVDLGSHAAGDDFRPVDPATVSLRYRVAYFTGQGEFVASDERVLACTDAVYRGDCRAARGHLFLGWNGFSREGRKAGTGAYVARLRYQVVVAGRSVEEGALDQTWGLLRGR